MLESNGPGLVASRLSNHLYLRLHQGKTYTIRTLTTAAANALAKKDLMDNPQKKLCKDSLRQRHGTADMTVNHKKRPAQNFN